MVGAARFEASRDEQLAILDFSVELSLDGEPLSAEDRKRILAASSGLALIKGRWVEIDREKLGQVLDHWQSVERASREGLTFAEGLRMLAGVSVDADALDEDADGRASGWASVVAGPWLESVLDELRDPARAPDVAIARELRAELRPYQRTGVRWLAALDRLGLGACLADDMGLGKTIQVLGLLLSQRRGSHEERAPSLLVVPASLIANWTSEIERFAPSLKTLVQGTRLYKVEVRIRAIAKPRWQAVVGACSGSMNSLVDLLQGKLSERVMDVVTKPGEGLFPTPQEIELDCSCPDWATMCKHVAAVLYGVGAHLDHEPGVLFRLRGVDLSELTTGAAATSLLTDSSRVRTERRLDAGVLSEVFGIAIDAGGETPQDRAVKDGGSSSAAVTRAAASAPPAARSRNGTARRRSRLVSAAAGSDQPRAPKRRTVSKAPASKVQRNAEATPDAGQLRALGIRLATTKVWLSRGVLRETPVPDSYAITKETAAYVGAHVAKLRR